jgi:hypothetical protein
MAFDEWDLTLLAPFAILGGLSASLIWLRGLSYAIWFFVGTACLMFALQWYLWWGSGHMTPIGGILNRFVTIGASYLTLFCCFCGYLYLLSNTDPPKNRIE